MFKEKYFRVLVCVRVGERTFRHSVLQKEVCLLRIKSRGKRGVADMRQNMGIGFVQSKRQLLVQRAGSRENQCLSWASSQFFVASKQTKRLLEG